MGKTVSALRQPVSLTHTYRGRLCLEKSFDRCSVAVLQTIGLLIMSLDLLIFFQVIIGVQETLIFICHSFDNLVNLSFLF